MADSMNETLADSSASGIERNLEKLTLEEEQNTARDETPEPKSYSSDTRSREEVRKKLFADGDKTPKRQDGEWLESHPWQDKTPSCQETMDTTINVSKVYTVSQDWQDGANVDLKEIYSKLSTFIYKMKGRSIRQELEDILQIDGNSLKLDTNSTLLKAINFEKVKRTPHLLEITQKQDNVPPKDKPSYRQPGKNNNFKAFSLEKPHQPSQKNSWFLDCEYMLKMHLPDDSLKWFKHDDQQGKRITKINPEMENKRWIFIPSFRRANIALLKWPQDNIVTQESTIRILVVRPSEFEEYVSCCGHEFPIISLPQDEIGAGYPRYWIQKIALRLKLQFIWMIDDSVECFYEYHPEQKPLGSYAADRRRKFGLVFECIEHFVQDADDNEKPIAAMSPRRWNPLCRPKKPFSRKPPQVAVYLNLRALSEKNVYYRPELKTFEDMIFGYECEQKGLKVYRDNRIPLQDHQWKDTRASSPSVKNM